MKMKHLAAVAAVALSGSAFAATSSLGTLGSAGFGDAFASGAAFFNDTFTFTLTGPSTVSGFIGGSGIGQYALSVLDSSLTVVGTDTTPGTFSFSGLSGGNYALQVVGFGASAGSFYGGSVVATPVPEPETYALMLAGLGMVGFIAARRRG